MPVPVLFCPSLERTERHIGGVTAAEVRARQGVVLSIGSSATEAAATLLATATQRPHKHVGHGDLAGQLAGIDSELPVAVVGLPVDFERIGSWPGDQHPLVGVITARTIETLSVLIYRTLVVEADPADGTLVSAHPLWRDAAQADVVTIDELAESASTRPALRVLRGQGRECSYSLLDGMVCGRAVPNSAPMAPASVDHRSASCQLGEVCFRSDLTADNLLPAHELNSVLSILHSCSAIPVGNNAYDNEVSVALGLLEGTTTAVIGCIAVHVAQDSSVAALQDGLQKGLTLGGGHPPDELRDKAVHRHAGAFRTARRPRAHPPCADRPPSIDSTRCRTRSVETGPARLLPRHSDPAAGAADLVRY